MSNKLENFPFAVHLPINPLSFGNVSFNILNEFFKRNYNPVIFVHGDKADLSAFSTSKEFQSWLVRNHARSLKDHKRNHPTLKLWHINGSMDSPSEKQILFTFYELDNPTKTEINILNNQAATVVTSHYTQNVLTNSGCKNIFEISLGFDANHFSVKNDVKFSQKRITFGLVGKLEKRKHHVKLIQSWVKKYGGNKNYFLNCAIQNSFMTPEQQSQFLLAAMGGQKYFNVNFLGFMPTNALYNDFLNSNDIIIGMSGAEGWGLPEFHSVGLGKHGVILNAHAYKSWANKENSVLISPNGKVPAYDNLFFKEGSEYNQGNIYDFSEDEFIEGCEEAIKRYENNPINIEGLKLQSDFTWAKTADQIEDVIIAHV
jgi:hypothetical protein